MRAVGYDLWFFPESVDFGESTPVSGIVAALGPETVMFKAVYVSSPVETGLNRARTLLTIRDYWGRQGIYFLRLTASSDGPPFRSAFVYEAADEATVQRFDDPRIPGAYNVGVYNARAILYQALRVDSPHGWQTDFRDGRPAFFLTGTSGAAELWRLTRLETDALDRQLLTLAPVRLSHGIAIPNFDLVPDPRLRTYLVEQFAAFQRAVASAAHLEIVDRAANIAEGVLEYCLTPIGRVGARTLAERLQEAKTVLEDRDLRRQFLLTDLGYHLAHKFRLLHARVHANQAMERGGTMRPEIGMGAASDLSELLVEVGLAQY